ncbi:hypothetical protein [Kutzneria buriramensis]|uniref:Uncharacterized protein n=1 Tax=Kutzneria buriramensis TaxID=1045776 RepID=A0A3E0HP96_9PSEU|nr:hypothetical protein [Kutzneria buriramensis]REH48249.1 hypothetical protein BCF44_105107 [Kutzneria buriramensis]
MRLFVDHADGPPSDDRFAGPLRLRERPGGLDEIEWRPRPHLPAFVLYHARMTSSMSVLLACCGNTFDSTFAGISDDLVTELGQHWTSFAHMLVNGERGDLSDLGITRIADPVDGVKGGCVGRVVNPRGGEDELKDGLARVISGAVSAIGEGVEAAEKSPLIRGLLATQSDHALLDERLEAIAAAGFSFRHTRSILDLEWATG